MRFTRAMGGAVAIALLAAACGDDSDSDDATGDEESAAVEAESVSGTPCDVNDDVDPEAEYVHAVPDEYSTIQEAVDAAEPCDLVLVSPGEYNEAVDVTTDDLTIRGLDRNEVILDGEFELDNGIRVLEADGVAIENMTARNYTTNGFFWTGVERYRGSYLTAHNLGSYGIYAFDSTVGVIEHSYGSGASDGGVYIGQCNPCDAVVDNVLAEHNGLGYSGTNASGELYIVNSTFRHNRTGIVPNSGTYEDLYPQDGIVIVGNTVNGNHNPDTAAIEVAQLATGTGILVAGGNNNVIERNLVFDHELVGLGVIPIDDDEIEGGLFWPSGNVVRDNVVSDSELADVALADEDDEAENCFEGNEFTSSAPEDIEAVAPCDGEPGGDRDDNALDLGYLLSRDTPDSGDYEDQPVPDDQENMPDADSAPWQSAGDPPTLDLDEISVPARPDEGDDDSDGDDSDDEDSDDEDSDDEDSDDDDADADADDSDDEDE